MSCTGLSLTWYSYQLQCSPHLSQESPQPSFRCSSLLTLPTHLSMNRDVGLRFHVHLLAEDVPSILSMLPPITSYVDKATSKPVSNVHPD